MLSIQSIDGDIIQVEQGIVRPIKYINTLIGDDSDSDSDSDSSVDDEEVIQFPFLSTKDMIKVVEFANHYQGKEPKPIPMPLNSMNNFGENVPEWDAKFIKLKDGFEYKDLLSLLDASVNLQYDGLREICLAKLASITLTAPLSTSVENMLGLNKAESKEEEEYINENFPLFKIPEEIDPETLHIKYKRRS